MNKDTVELDDIDHAIETETDDYPEPEVGDRFYIERHKLWEMRFGYQEDKSKPLEENIRHYIKYNYERGLIKKILDMKSTYFYQTGKILCE